MLYGFAVCFAREPHAQNDHAPAALRRRDRRVGGHFIRAAVVPRLYFPRVGRSFEVFIGTGRTVLGFGREEERMGKLVVGVPLRQVL